MTDNSLTTGIPTLVSHGRPERPSSLHPIPSNSRDDTCEYLQVNGASEREVEFTVPEVTRISEERLQSYILSDHTKIEKTFVRVALGFTKLVKGRTPENIVT